MFLALSPRWVTTMNSTVKAGWMIGSGVEMVRRPRLIGGASSGQAVVEASLAFTFLITLLLGAVSVGQLINYNIGLDNAAAAGATAAAIAANTSGGNASTAAVNAVNKEQGVSSWVACGGTVVPPCVSVSASTQSTGAATSVTVEQVTLHGSFQPLFTILGINFPVTVSASASK